MDPQADGPRGVGAHVVDLLHGMASIPARAGPFHSGLPAATHRDDDGGNGDTEPYKLGKKTVIPGESGNHTVHLKPTFTWGHENSMCKR